MYSYRNSRPRSFVRKYALTASVSVVGAALASFAFLGPAASDINTNSRVFAAGLNIRLDRGSPAFAALEDTWTPPVARKVAPPPPVKVIELAAGASAESLAEKLIRDNRREHSLIAQERSARANNSTAMAQMAAQMLRRMSSRLRSQTEAAATAPQNVRTVSLAGLNVSREEILAGLFLPLARSGNTRVGDTGRTPKFAQSATTKDGDGDTGGFHTNTAQTGGPTVRQVVIAGPLEFAGGLALTNPMDRIVIYRDVDGETVESGQVWPREGRYEIFVEETVGQLIGELRAMPFGDVIGRGTLELAGLAPAKNSADKRRISGVKLALHPVPQGISGRVVSADVPGRKVKGAEVGFIGLPFEMKTSKEGKFEQSGILDGSSVIVKAERPGFWGTLAFAHSGEDNEVELFADVDGHIVRNILRANPTVGTRGGIVWGRVTYHGAPAAGARVEMMTSQAETKAIYFDSAMKPDPRLQETTANGLYAYYPVSAGAHAVQVRWSNGRVVEPRVFPADDRAVSRVDIESARERSAKVKVFDAFRTDYPLPAEITHLGMNRGFQIDGTGAREVKFAAGHGLMIFDANVSAAYARVRLTLSRDRRTILVPMLQSAWIERLKGEGKVNIELGQGSVVGFVQGSAPYIARIDGAQASARVVYFDSRGEPTGREYGEPGGGFAIFNAGEGFKSVTVQPSGSMKLYTAVALVERNVVNVVNHWIR